MGSRGPKKGEGGRPRKKAGTNEARTGDGYVRVTVGAKSKGKQVYHRTEGGTKAWTHPYDERDKCEVCTHA